MKKLLRQLQHEPDSFGDLHYLMRGMLKGICSGLGMPAACIALLNRERTALKVFYAEGLPEQAPLRRFMIDLRTPSLFSKLMEKQAAALLNPDNRDRYLAHIPPAMAERLPQHCMMMSIDAGAQPIGLVMALGANHQPAFSQAEFIEFKNLCIVTCHGLTALDHFNANQWIGVIKGMEPRTSLTPEQARMLTQYVQKHASDTHSAL